jgi:hypothetical protein
VAEDCFGEDGGQLVSWHNAESVTAVFSCLLVEFETLLTLIRESRDTLTSKQTNWSDDSLDRQQMGSGQSSSCLLRSSKKIVKMWQQITLDLQSNALLVVLLAGFGAAYSVFLLKPLQTR